MNFIKNNVPGILLCLAAAIPSWKLGQMFPIIGGPVFGILLGMLLALFRRPVLLDSGIRFTSKKILQWSIILLGFEMDLFNVIRVGSQSLLVMIFTLAASFLTAYFLGKAMKIDGKTTALIGAGTSICGGSAIAAAAPVIQADDEEVAQSISTIFLFNILAVFIFPPLGHALGLSDTGFGMWAGTAINDTSSVVAAGASWSASAGNNAALAFATIVKLTRTLMIVPITLVLAVYTTKKMIKKQGAGADKNYRLSRIFPWFVLGFVLAAVINTFLPLPDGLPEMLVTAGKFLIVMAMTAIGLNTNLKKLLTSGAKPIFLGLCCWFVVAAVSLTVQYFMGLM